MPFGPRRADGWVNFSLFSRHATAVTLVIRELDGPRRGKIQEIRLDPTLHRSGDIWHARVHTDHRLCYGYRLEGSDQANAAQTFSPGQILIDPYCRHLAPRPWGHASPVGAEPLCLIDTESSFDWQGDRPLRTPLADTVIYELHVRGFTRHKTSQVSAPGTFQGVIDKIDYLCSLGVTAVEFLPVTAWDETDNRFFDPDSGARLLNLWGYNPLTFFALHGGLAAKPQAAMDEFKTMVRSLHQAGIEVILDMVFNHTGESDLAGVTSSFRGIDNQVYYLVDPNNGEYLNFSGCGNTLNCNHPVVRRLIIDALRYWVQEMHVDGFRFDLAAIFSRGRNGVVLTEAPLIEEIAEDPVLRDTKIIAEAWDASGLYQVGSFSSDPRWLEWNGRFRDDVRRFFAGLPDSVSTLASRLAGSSDLYGTSGRGPLNSINFVTSHDGFTLYDLVSYDHKHNQRNGEQNRDGEVHNLSWNSGHEGDPAAEDILVLRRRRMRSLIGVLLLSQGVPMLTAGDEFGRTQQGNNNSWCQDNEIGWLDWSLAETNRDLLRFVRFCIQLRKNHRCFRRDLFFPPPQHDGTDHHPEISWQSLHPGKPDWSAECQTLGCLLHDPGDEADFLLLFNGSRSHDAPFIIPALPPSRTSCHWRMIIDSSAAPPADCSSATAGAKIDAGTELVVGTMGLVVLQSHRSKPTPPRPRSR
ncbi:glycogen operon protein GlgX homolog [Desulfofustis limnaeus]|uniref:Glycogen operon protein GlgX homolog n=1 Tax=Desulfofustis limnaeus TaxID=2740163 RepID=A0ABM7W4K9_9BACT|nr:glycogen operon protein GlgX homolog [Desulfofustis limnaeus]